MNIDLQKFKIENVMINCAKRSMYFEKNMVLARITEKGKIVRENLILSLKSGH